ncbi:MAG: DUF4926 domain-containing protein [Candidatus Contendobacter sp.]
MNTKFHLHDVVALLEDLPAKHFETDQPLLLRRGQIGTIVMTYDGNAFEVEFADPDGRTYALLAVQAGRLMRLRDVPEYAMA